LFVKLFKRKRRRRRKNPLSLSIKTETLYSVAAVVLVVIGVLVIVSFTGQGQMLQLINSWLVRTIGIGVFFVPFVFIAAGLVMMRTKWPWTQPNVLLGAVLVMTGVVGVSRSGQLGRQTFDNLAVLLSPAGTVVLFAAVLVVGLLILSEVTLRQILEGAAAVVPKPGQGDKDGDQEGDKRGFGIPRLRLGRKPSGFTVNENVPLPADAQGEGGDTAIEGASVAATAAAASAAGAAAEDGLSDTTLTANTAPMIWEYPPLSLLSSSTIGEADRGDIKTNADTIETTLDSFGISAQIAEVNYGPSVTQYALKITRGTKLSRITGLSTDLALALAAPTGQIRIEAPIAGRSLVGIEVPNRSAQYVTLRQMLSSSEMKKHQSKLAVALGIDVAGKPVITNLAAMPHILLAGATGSGKSVSINTFLCSMLFRASPAEVKFILVDPKRVELTIYNDIPHLLTPVIVEPSKVVSALKWAGKEMENRYKKLAEVGVKNIEAYNELAGFAAMPHIVIVVDELADVMLFAPGEVEEAVTRIAQMARAVGIHLVLATQRPSVDVITGLIKANVPARISFNVSSMMDSRVILDMPGAEKLLGRGDMLFIPPDRAKPTRVQGTLVTEKETRSLIDYLKSQGQQPEYEDDITTKYKAATISGGSGGDGGLDRDHKFDEAVRLVSQYDKASSSMLQRRLSVGYARAARILDQLYEAGLVGPPDGSKPRDVNMKNISEYMASVDRVEG